MQEINGNFKVLRVSLPQLIPEVDGCWVSKGGGENEKVIQALQISSPPRAFPSEGGGIFLGLEIWPESGRKA